MKENPFHFKKSMSTWKSIKNSFTKTNNSDNKNVN